MNYEQKAKVDVMTRNKTKPDRTKKICNLTAITTKLNTLKKDNTI